MAPEVRSDLILDEALRLFAERHHSNVSMRDIASACGVNAGLIYYYFTNKEQLFGRALAHAIDQLHAGYAALRPTASDPRSEMMAWLDMHISIAPTLARMTKLMADYAASAPQDPQVGGLIRDFYAREQALLEDCIFRGIAAGLFGDVDVRKTARIISLQLDGIFYATGSRGDDRVAADIEDLRSLVDSLLRARGAGERA
ncbi:helix-turn-helix domain-containing protein [Hansschlegelia sp.]|uniref:TetR/AcrR family transcriptional regulator n=1 Tax=Hansschlegelia sp. TaxID=2041892 RepID=UPI002CFF75CB|nr:helix-turn-helix domain-containing protein [Hansschlegelia sp.]HVI28731.1 helix-turn-helix domain-containing protein [Hansschlegelia sp.]